MRIFIAESIFRFLYVSYEKSARKASCARLYHQADSALGFAKRLRVGHDYGIDLLVRHRGLIPAGIETAGIDFPGYLLGFHAVAGAGQEVDWGLSFNVFNLSRSGAIPCLLPYPTRRFITFSRLVRASSPEFRVIFLSPARGSLPSHAEEGASSSCPVHSFQKSLCLVHKN